MSEQKKRRKYHVVVRGIETLRRELVPIVGDAIDAKNWMGEEGWWELNGYDNILKRALDEVLRHRARWERADKHAEAAKESD